MGRTVAVLAVQGAFAEHERCLAALGCTAVELRQGADLRRSFDGLVLPGGESTVQAKLLRELGMMEPLRRLIAEGLPVLGTCAGLILLAESTGDGRHCLAEDATQAPLPVEGFATLPVRVRRNGYGRQLGSFTAEAPLLRGSHAGETIPLTFIRAPRIVEAAPTVEVLAALPKGGLAGEGGAHCASASAVAEPVAVRFGNQVGCAFHPELDGNPLLYQMFLGLMGA